MIAWGIPAAAIVTYWLNGLMLLLIDSVWRGDVLTQFRLQQDKSFDTSKIWKVAQNILSNQVMIVIPAGHIYGWLHTRGIGLYSSEALPSTTERFMHMILYVILDEFAFYYGHLWLHVNKTKWFNYRRIHKIHHEFTSPIALTASYCHPVEMIISNVLPLTGGMLLCGSHIYTGLVWTVFAVLGTQTHHCGYRWPWTPFFDHQPDFHDFHHEKFNTNYGLTGWCDALHGTDKMWNERVAELQAAREKAGQKPRSSGSALMYYLFVATFVTIFLLDRASASGWGLDILPTSFGSVVEAR